MNEYEYVPLRSIIYNCDVEINEMGGGECWNISNLPFLLTQLQMK